MAWLLDIAPEISFSFLASIALIPKFNSTYRCTIENEYLCIRIKSFASLKEQKVNSIFESQKYNEHIFIAVRGEMELWFNRGHFQKLLNIGKWVIKDYSQIIQVNLIQG